MSVADILIMIVVICVTLGVMLAVVYVADRHPRRGRRVTHDLSRSRRTQVAEEEQQAQAISGAERAAPGG